MAAILDAASRLFAEKSYDAVTMTAVAERSNTAIGQIYRFFPTKEILADAVLSQYRQRLDQGLGQLASGTGASSPGALADALIAFMTGLGEHRTAALLLLDSRDNTSEQREALRARMLSHISGILAPIRSRPSASTRDGAAEVVLQLLKLAATDPLPGRSRPEDFQIEIRAALAAYLGDLMGVAGA